MFSRNLDLNRNNASLPSIHKRNILRRRTPNLRILPLPNLPIHARGTNIPNPSP